MIADFDPARTWGALIEGGINSIGLRPRPSFWSVILSLPRGLRWPSFLTGTHRGLWFRSEVIEFVSVLIFPNRNPKRYKKGRPYCGGCREKNHDNRSTLTR